MPLIESSSLTLLLWALIGYGLGSIPFGLLLTQLLGLGNLREIGSGNIGATNVLRTGNKTAAALTLLLDAGKGVVAVLLARVYSGEDAAQLAALMAMLGHCYPVWLGFKGGKGVATFLGLMWALAWPVGLGCCIAWAVAASLTRISSMGGLMAAAVSTFLLVLTGNGTMLLLGIALTLLVFWRHRANITRIRQGTEPKIGQKS
ncbi:glycerol-3-phosphate 1-O-acyltransferase PlsY [Pseudosulfitobacter pseudonitzschiae]|uniref:Glycerol-3-phosphate acyltransferase n=1 Tax=Pseudosulfitobacter pseudonitzschiae TaxID=1402135 RepID=A0A073J408_9RHOB|nr:glycerol-3-phosphate 1-O-acyltransferase PlsY [Pseudosulfitobacter pseudonitzschiae]KEJ96719.1 glycerol-3-phosphate acyltransferase [Pseudosulfitobacter pseudonitzschiae]MBM1814208.1 glycerol-3-phosphate 1-O-acyltransferase PlsY [Pseudosulfitobacter pseudonitzschiae]MBM1831201.1 glycerol-3-phosphate 1-O-acyltransferase PlsY [Pseudosulfitobacter pseudonitzschiae]MBM1836068.1 glycerol-3-phosphate 1-O-acyltransferase PlsY [Pseudosulfitobacter pseudonitzschiae]MBM1840914.1 glycerol-3-phosphate 